jgi:Tfp pilus assembly protein PilP
VMGGILVLLLAGGAGEKGTPCGKVSPLWAAEGDALRQGAPTLPPAAPAGGSGGPLAKPIPAAALTPAPTYEYHAAGKPDPFKPYMETDAALKKKKEETLLKKKVAKGGKPVSPLQQVDIEQLRMVGIAGDDHRRTAIVEDGVAKKYYPLFVGTYIGMNGGRIVSIQPDRVIIEERLQGQTRKGKKPKVKRIVMKLRKDE